MPEATQTPHAVLIKKLELSNRYLDSDLVSEAIEALRSSEKAVQEAQEATREAHKQSSLVASLRLDLAKAVPEAELRAAEAFLVEVWESGVAQEVDRADGVKISRQRLLEIASKFGVQGAAIYKKYPRPKLKARYPVRDLQDSFRTWLAESNQSDVSEEMMDAIAFAYHSGWRAKRSNVYRKKNSQ